MVEFSDFLPPLQLPDPTPAPEDPPEATDVNRKEAVKSRVKVKATKSAPKPKPIAKAPLLKGSEAKTGLKKQSDTFESATRKVTAAGLGKKKSMTSLSPPAPSSEKGAAAPKPPPPVPAVFEKVVSPEVVEAPPPPPPPSPPKPRLFKVGGMEMSGADIRATIEIVKEMEGVMITTLKKALEMQATPGASMDRRDRERVAEAAPPEPVEVPAPDGGTRTITARSEEDNVDVVNARFLTSDERAEFKALAKKLPDGLKTTESGDIEEVSTPFKEAMLELLDSEYKIEMYEIRTLVPIKETGVLSLKDYIQNEQGSRVKPQPHFEGTSSAMLTGQAIKLGIMDH